MCVCVCVCMCERERERENGIDTRADVQLSFVMTEQDKARRGWGVPIGGGGL